MGRNVVLWSGGADSTSLLDHYAGVSCRDYPVVALVVEHSKISPIFARAQQKARAEYAKLAKRRGFHLLIQTVKTSGNFEFGLNDSCRYYVPQPIVWLNAISQVVKDGDTVFMGYIGGDLFWHFKDRFEAVFKAFCVLKGIDASLEYPLEFQRKSDILAKLKRQKIPARCWFSCERTTDGKPCGICSKCQEVNDARDLMKKRKKGEVE